MPGVMEGLKRTGLRITELSGEKSTLENVLAEMKKHRWVHLASDASQNTLQRTNSILHLNGGELSLAAIMSDPHKGRTVYLSGSSDSIQYFALHVELFPLATGMITAGYSTVITTTWPPRCKDTTMVAQKVYARLIDEKPINARAAKALHVAVGHLRADVGEKEFMRW
ncbi:hypothetical protein FRC07_010247, partial [Ceratobasidium sp. 392]